jgi:predicted acetyltransferase
VSEIRILTADDLDVFVDIFCEAYPGIEPASEEERVRLKERLRGLGEKEPTATYYGLFRQGRLLGGMRCHDFTMNLLHTRVPTGGVGQVAVALLHKKEHVAKEMMSFFLNHYRESGAPIVLLYPFRPDFYKRMGFGYGTKMNQYRIKPSALPKGPSKAHLRYLGEDDRRALLDCTTRMVDRTHGMIDKSDYELMRLMTNARHRIVGYEEDGRVLGYLAFVFERGEDFIRNDIHVRELVYETPAVLSELLTFLHTQADQIRTVILETQDEFFHHLLLDPRNDSASLIPSVFHESNIQGVGIMVRVVDVPGVFRRLSERDFGGQTCRIKLTIGDSFLPENAGSTCLSFEGGRLRTMGEGECDVEVRLDVSEFSSLLMGAVNFKSLYRYGLAGISDPGYVHVVDRVFAVEDKPVCTTAF